MTRRPHFPIIVPLHHQFDHPPDTPKCLVDFHALVPNALKAHKLHHAIVMPWERVWVEEETWRFQIVGYAPDVYLEILMHGHREQCVLHPAELTVYDALRGNMLERRQVKAAEDNLKQICRVVTDYSEEPQLRMPL